MIRKNSSAFGEFADNAQKRKGGSVGPAPTLPKPQAEKLRGISDKKEKRRRMEERPDKRRGRKARP